MNPWITVALPIVVALITVAGGDVARAFLRRRIAAAEAEQARANAAQVISETAVELVEPIREEMTRVRREVRELADYVHLLHEAIFRPDAAIESIREFVKANGRLRT